MRWSRKGWAAGSAVAVAVLLVSAWTLFVSDGGSDADPAATSTSPAALLAGADTDLTGFARVDGPRPFDFPADHGPHPEFRHEWWYLTGHLYADDGRRFGYQVTIFRFATEPTEPDSESAWATNQLYMAHFALTDVDASHFHSFERSGRGALGLAGAQVEPLRVWLDDWSLQGEGNELFPLTVSVEGEAVGLELVLTNTKPMVLHGEAGYSRKGNEPGNASHYYSYTRLRASGTVLLDGEQIAVTGSGWLDREWGSSALGANVVGWDWFSLQLDDGRELMWFHLRNADGTIDPQSHGSLVERDGTVRSLSVAEVQATPLRWWETKRPGQRSRYPIEWRLTLPQESMDLRIAPVMDAQAWQGSFDYWEGAMQVSGSVDGKPIQGAGYLEMTGY